MRLFALFFIFSLSLSAQPVLTITDATKANAVAPYVYVYRDATHQLTAAQIAKFPLDSFNKLSQEEVIQFGYFYDKIWLRFEVKNKTREELYLIHSYRGFRRMEVIIFDENGQKQAFQVGESTPVLYQKVHQKPPVFPIGRTPSVVYLSIVSGNAHGDFIHIGGLGQALTYQRTNTTWQSFSLGIYVLVFLYAFIFAVRLRDPLIGWYALLMLSIILFYLDFYSFLKINTYFNTAFAYLLCWSLFHVHLLNLRFYSKSLYWAILGFNGLYYANTAITQLAQLVESSFISPLFRLLLWLKLDWGGFILLVLFLLLISLIYVAIKNLKQVWLYAIAFSISLSAMIISMFALYNIEWLPYTPYNNFFVPGTLIEIILLGFILAERTNQHRKDQARTQQQLIVQLQENLRQQNKLLQIRDEIARDLHDEVGATLTGIATSAKVIEKKMGHEQEEVKAVLGQMTTDSQEAIHTIRDTIWALNPDNDAPDKLLEKMKSVGFKLLMPHGIAFVFENEVPVSQLPVFSMEQRRNLYLVYKEALHNIAKHSQAANAQVRIFQQKADLHVRISDDGKGFDAAQIQEGNGLKNFQKRAKEGGFEVKVKSAEGGTEVEIIILFNHKVHHE